MRLNRRQVMLGAGVTGAGLLAGCGRLPRRAAPLATMPRIGYLAGATAATGNPEAFELGLREPGYTHGRNVLSEYRFGEGEGTRLQALATELVQLPVDLILAAGGPLPAMAARDATSGSLGLLLAKAACRSGPPPICCRRGNFAERT
jgi:hypothetical protein